MRTTIARDIADIAFVFDQSGRTTQPIKIKASASTLQKAVRDARPGFCKITGSGGGGESFFFNCHPIELLTR